MYGTRIIFFDDPLSAVAQPLASVSSVVGSAHNDAAAAHKMLALLKVMPSNAVVPPQTDCARALAFS